MLLELDELEDELLDRLLLDDDELLVETLGAVYVRAGAGAATGARAGALGATLAGR